MIKDLSEWRRIVIFAFRTAVITLSVLLIIYISADTFKGDDFLRNGSYMRFQLWACVVFLLDFFVELALEDDRKGYVRRRWAFFLLSIPYLNIITQFDLHLQPNVVYFLRFVPLARGVAAIAIVGGAMTKNRITSFMVSYIITLVAVIYLGSLIFLFSERPVNPEVNNFGTAVWWALMNATTLGCDISATTLIGKILECVLSLCGIVMFPLFTVYITTYIRRFALASGIDEGTDAGGDDGDSDASAG